MIVTRYWLQEFIDINDINDKKLCEGLNTIGLEVNKIDKITIPKGVVVGYVKDCKKHKSADKLWVCQVDIGDENLQIVCGAKNIAKDIYVAVATIGTKLSENFIIKNTTLRGENSSGMICSANEINLPKTNDGIMILDNSIGKLDIGAELQNYKLLNDTIIDIELTANRGDCMSIYGVARDLSVYLDIKHPCFDTTIKYTNKAVGQVLSIQDEKDIDANIVLSSVDVKSFKSKLLYDIRTSVANCYDKNIYKNIASYATHSVGVLYDMISEKLKQNKLGLSAIDIKKDKDGFDSIYSKEKITTIGINTNTPDISQIQKDEINIAVVSFYINPDTINKLVFEKKIKTDDIYYKSSRGSEPNLNFGTKYLHKILHTCGADIHSGLKKSNKNKPITILKIDINSINKIIGQDISKQTIIQLLENLQFIIKPLSETLFEMTVPYCRTDIKNIADITEEIVRMVGIDNIKSIPLKLSEQNRQNKTISKLDFFNTIRQKAISAGFYEQISFLFVQKSKALKYGFDTIDNKKELSNPISQELDTTRTTLLLNLLDGVKLNYNQGLNSVALFEIGEVYDKNRVQTNELSFVFSGYKDMPNIQNKSKPSKINISAFVQKISNIIGQFELIATSSIPNNLCHPYNCADIIVKNQKIGFLSELDLDVKNEFGIDDTYIACIKLDKLAKQKIVVKPYSKFQSVYRDLSIVTPKSMPYIDISNTIKNLNIKEIIKFNIIDLYTDKKLKTNESLTIRFLLQNQYKTMSENDILAIMQKILQQLEQKLELRIR